MNLGLERSGDFCIELGHIKQSLFIYFKDAIQTQRRKATIIGVKMREKWRVEGTGLVRTIRSERWPTSQCNMVSRAGRKQTSGIA